MSPNVVRAITRLNIGGPARQALLLTKALSDTYHSVLIAGTPPPHEGELKDPQVSVTHVPLVRSLSPINDTRAFYAIKRQIEQRRPALVHTHMAKAGVLARIAAYRLKPRPVIVHTYHGHVLDGYFGRAATGAFTQVERSMASRSDALIAVSDEIRDELIDLGVGVAEKWHVIAVGLDLGPFLAVNGPSGGLRKALGIPREAVVVGAVGRLTAIKDHATLVSAMEQLPGVHLVLLGDGELSSKLKSQADKQSLRGRIHFPGWVADVASALADIDVIAQTSVNEGTPVALIEAAAAGRPIVTTDVGGVPSVVINGVTGIFVPTRDPSATATALRHLAGDSRLRSSLGRAGRRQARTRFAEDRLISDIRALYDELLQRR